MYPIRKLTPGPSISSIASTRSPVMPENQVTAKGHSLIIPNHMVLPPVCIATGASDVPLLMMRWSHVRASARGESFWFDFYITPAQKKRRDRAKVWFWIWLTLFLATFPVFALGSAFALESTSKKYAFLAVVILTYAGLLTGLVLSSRIRHYVKARGRWWRG